MKASDREDPDDLASKLYTLAIGFRDNYLLGREPDLEEARLMASLYLRLDHYLTYDEGRLPQEWSLSLELAFVTDAAAKFGGDIDEATGDIGRSLQDLEDDLKKVQGRMTELKVISASARSAFVKQLNEAAERLLPKPKQEAKHGSA